MGISLSSPKNTQLTRIVSMISASKSLRKRNYGYFCFRDPVWKQINTYGCSVTDTAQRLIHRNGEKMKQELAAENR